MEQPLKKLYKEILPKAQLTWNTKNVPITQSMTRKVKEQTKK